MSPPHEPREFPSPDTWSVEAVVVDLDGTLLRSDLLVESFAALFGKAPLEAVGKIGTLARGKAALKAAIVDHAEIDAALLPYNNQVLQWLQALREKGCRLYLASASDQRLVGAVAAHLGFFDAFWGSDGSTNLAGEAKLARIRAELGNHPFAYFGNDAADLPIWREAAQCIAVDCDTSVRRRLLAFAPAAIILETKPDMLPAWLRLARVKQYVKNALVAVPLLVSHQISPANIGLTIVAGVAFSLCASSVYICNDLIDLEGDRRHPTKRPRPLADGSAPIVLAVPVAGVLLATSALLAVWVGWLFAALLGFYFVLTIAYTMSLKRKMIIDAVTLAVLYSLRMLAGAAAINVVPSVWLLGFSLFVFASLAFVKRYTELSRQMDAGGDGRLANRNYEVGDISVVGALAAACGFNAVTFLALYMASDNVRKLYRHPELMWIICPVMMYWIGRNILLAHRRLMDDDPIVFALSDRPSWMCAALIALASVAATF